MPAVLIADTGPLVASLIRGDQFHHWAREDLGLLRSPLMTCEPVLAETAHIVAANGGDPAVVLEMLQTGVLTIGIRADDDPAALVALMHRYRNIPMSLADACLVRLAERFRQCVIWTTDSDFRIYRRNGRQVIPLRMPPVGR